MPSPGPDLQAVIESPLGYRSAPAGLDQAEAAAQVARSLWDLQCGLCPCCPRRLVQERKNGASLTAIGVAPHQANPCPLNCLATSPTPPASANPPHAPSE